MITPPPVNTTTVRFEGQHTLDCARAGGRGQRQEASGQAHRPSWWHQSTAIALLAPSACSASAPGAHAQRGPRATRTHLHPVHVVPCLLTGRGRQDTKGSRGALANQRGLQMALPGEGALSLCLGFPTYLSAVLLGCGQGRRGELSSHSSLFSRNKVCGGGGADEGHFLTPCKFLRCCPSAPPLQHPVAGTPATEDGGAAPGASPLEGP